MEGLINNGVNEIKLIIFLDDDGKRKEKHALILNKSDSWLYIQLWNKKENKELQNEKGEVISPFELPSHRVLKIKDIK